MKSRELEFKRVRNYKERFIRQFGSFNCRYLILKSANEILKELNIPIEKESKNFIIENQNKEVLCYIRKRFDFNHILVFGEDNIVFNEKCFV